MQKSIRDIGSLFHRLQKEDLENNNIPQQKPFIKPQGYALFYSGRHAIFAVLNDISSHKKIRFIWLPNYYSNSVTYAITSTYNNVRFYDIDPFGPSLTFDVMDFASEHDVVILNNYWGLKSYSYNNHQKRPVIIEDHTHGWRSHECMNSNADYAISSLRKTYPIPLGAIAWKPNGDALDVDYQNDGNNSIDEAYLKLKLSQKLKRRYLESGNAAYQKKFLKLLIEGESLISKSFKVKEPSNDHLTMITDFLNRDPNNIKAKNLNYLRNLLEKTNLFKVIDRKDFTPFGLMLLFNNEDIFKDFKSIMVEHYIYPANFWPDNKLEDDWQYFFNIHIDFRYTAEDMQYLASNINSWIQSNA